MDIKISAPVVKTVLGSIKDLNVKVRCSSLSGCHSTCQTCSSDGPENCTSCSPGDYLAPSNECIGIIS